MFSYLIVIAVHWKHLKRIKAPSAIEGRLLINFEAAVGNRAVHEEPQKPIHISLINLTRMIVRHWGRFGSKAVIPQNRIVRGLVPVSG